VTFVPDSATNQNVTWSSDRTDVVTVSNAGVVTGMAAGNATITATTEDGGFKATCTVTVSSGAANAVENPSFSLAGGDYWGMEILTLSCATDGATVYYTTDGTTPTSASTKYASEIVLRSSQTVKAIAVKSGMAESDLVSNRFTIAYFGSGEDNFHRPAYFANGIATTLQTPVDKPYGYANNVKLNGGRIICVGYVYEQDNSNTYQPCYWTGTSYHECKLPTSQDANVSVTGGYAYGGFAIDDNGHIYIPGKVVLCTIATDAPGTYSFSSIPCYWVDGEYRALAGSSGNARLIALSKGSPVILGQEEGQPCYWVGDSSTLLAMPSGRTTGSARGLSYIDGAPYITGWNTETVTDSATKTTTSIQYPCYWANGGSPQELSLGSVANIASRGGYVSRVFKSASGDLYAGGYLIGDDYQDTPCYWKNGTCTTLPLPASGANVYGGVSSFQEVNGHVYMMGWYQNGNASNYIECYWLDGIYHTAFAGGNIAITVE
jgi:hypothetical protein